MHTQGSSFLIGGLAKIKKECYRECVYLTKGAYWLGTKDGGMRIPHCLRDVAIRIFSKKKMSNVLIIP